MGNFAEIRCTDVEAKNVSEFKSYMDQYTGPMLRFLVPSIIRSGPVRQHLHHFLTYNLDPVNPFWHIFKVRLSFNGQDDIMRYLINYSIRDRAYSEEFRNCQAFAADFFGFMAGKKDVEPTVKVNKVTYIPRAHMFLYNPAAFIPYSEKVSGDSSIVSTSNTSVGSTWSGMFQSEFYPRAHRDLLVRCDSYCVNKHISDI